MTIGNFDRDSRQSQHWTKTVEPQGWIVQQGDALHGIREQKSWTGTDYPITKPVYEKYVYRFSDGSVLRGKRRVDEPTRRKTTDHPYSAVITRSQTSSQDWDRYEYGALTEKVRNYPYTQGYLVQSGDWTSNDTLGVIGKLRAKIAGSDFNAGVFLAESGKALTTITDSATRIYRFLRALRKGEMRRAVSALLPDENIGGVSKRIVPTQARISRAVLEVQYAWRPLLQDAHASAEFLAKQLEFPLLQTYRVRATKPIRIVPNGPSPLGFANGSFTSYQIIARVSEVDVATLSGLVDPSSVLWEVTPYSFLADWFIPIGRYLEARSMASALTGTFVSTKTRVIKYAHGGSPDTNNGIVKVVFPAKRRGDGLFFEVQVDRSVSSSLFVPLPNWKRLSEVVSWQHALNATALLTRGAGTRHY